MSNFRLQIASPSGMVYDGEAKQISVRAIDGDVAILAGHIPYVTALKGGECRVYIGDEIKKGGRNFERDQRGSQTSFVGLCLERNRINLSRASKSCAAFMYRGKSRLCLYVKIG